MHEICVRVKIHFGHLKTSHRKIELSNDEKKKLGKGVTYLCSDTIADKVLLLLLFEWLQDVTTTEFYKEMECVIAFYSIRGESPKNDI